jgi:glutamate dehydrogenase/leucine dehydrogenase
MWSRYNAFLRSPPELTVAWRDRETNARGWLVVNSFRGGAAGGGTRVRLGATPREAGYLAKTMELKFALAGPAIGGAKAAIDFDPRDPRKEAVLGRWFAAIAPYLRERYGTAGDLNVDEVAEVIPLIRAIGLEHPQSGVVRGHLRPDAERFDRILDRLNRGVKAPVPAALGLNGRRPAVADMITGFGVAQAVTEYHDRVGLRLDGARILLEGFGNVGAATGLYLARAGARIVAVADVEKVLVEPAGLDADDIERLILQGPYRLLPPDPRCRPHSGGDPFAGVAADIFVCAAASGTLDEARLRALADAGVRVLACGANHPFRESRLGSIRTHRLADRRFAVIMDCLANLGKARSFSYLMEDGADAEPAALFSAVAATIRTCVDDMLDRAARPDRGLMAATIGAALDRIDAP